MKRKVLLQLVVPLLGLCVLFWMLAFEPFQAQQAPELLELSVLLRESDGSVWAVARQGMEQAAVDMGAELRFVSPGSANAAGEQRELLAREVENGADGILLAPADRTALAAEVENVSAHIPVVTLETDMSGQGAAACISVDNAALGETLGRTALHGVPVGGTVLLLDSLPGDSGVAERLAAAAEVLEVEGRRVRFCRPADRSSLRHALLEALETERPALVLAFEASALEEASQTVRGLAEPPLLYGTGATSAIAAGLEQGWITAIAAQNEFAAGYLAVAAAVNAARQEPAREVKPLSFSILRRETMYEPDNQKLLLPVVR